MSRSIAVWIGIALAGAGCLQAASQRPASPPAASSYRALLDRYCVTCHNEKLRTAALVLDKIDVERVGAGAEVWEKVLSKLRVGAMPPPGRPRPDRATSDAVVSWLETELDGAAKAHPNPGRPAVHRLNRIEYTNAVRDLLALEIDGQSLLPADVSGYGFDNIAEALSVSPVLLERYYVSGGEDQSPRRGRSRYPAGDGNVRRPQEPCTE